MKKFDFVQVSNFYTTPLSIVINKQKYSGHNSVRCGMEVSQVIEDMPRFPEDQGLESW